MGRRHGHRKRSARNRRNPGGHPHPQRADRSPEKTKPPARPQQPVSRIPLGWWEEAFADNPSPSEQRGHRCGEKQMLSLVAYDITEPSRLRQIAKICEDYGVRIQYSIFECRLPADRFDIFWNELTAAIDPETDRLVAYKVCTACAKEIRDAGTQIHAEKAVAYVF